MGAVKNFFLTILYTILGLAYYAVIGIVILLTIAIILDFIMN